MDQRIKKLWVDRLRAWADLQGHGKLCADDRYCCLGVLCEIAVEERVITKWMAAPPLPGRPKVMYYGTPNNEDHNFDSSATRLPEAVIAWADLRKNIGANLGSSPMVPTPRDAAGNLMFPTSRVNLINLNDRYGFTFHQIADLVEEHL